MHQVTALFVRKNSVYKTMAGVDSWDKERDARKWRGGSAIVAHPPCAQWGRMSQWAHKKPAEKRLALLALDLVDRWGGVVEHPVTSRLWGHCIMRKPGWLYTVDQQWFGHRAQKRTTLYINGIKPADLPAIPYLMEEPAQPVQNMGTAERERTPPAFAEWLVEIARRCSVGSKNKLIPMADATKLVMRSMSCTCHADDKPPVCQHRYAVHECLDSYWVESTSPPKVSP